MPSDKKKHVNKEKAKELKKERKASIDNKVEQRVSESQAEDNPDENEQSTANHNKFKREIKSNWSKYEIPLDGGDDDQEINLNVTFEDLVNTTHSSGSYFKFKHEQSWDEKVETSAYDKYFQIDFKDLGQSVCSIPFYERNEIPLDYFTSTDIKTMNSRAVSFKNIKISAESINENVLKNIVGCLKESKINNEDIEFKRDILDDTDLSLDLITAVSKKTGVSVDLKKSPPFHKNDPETKPSIIKENEEDLEQWLDDFLES